MNIKHNIIIALESRKKDGVPIVENVPIRMRVNFASRELNLLPVIALMWQNGMAINNE